MSWVGVLVVCAGAFAQKLIGALVPPRLLAARPRSARAVELLPAALLAALVVTAAAASGPRLALDARLAGVAVAAGLLLLRAPLLLVIVAAAAATALARLAG